MELVVSAMAHRHRRLGHDELFGECCLPIVAVVVSFVAAVADLLWVRTAPRWVRSSPRGSLSLWVLSDAEVAPGACIAVEVNSPDRMCSLVLAVAMTTTSVARSVRTHKSEKQHLTNSQTTPFPY